jgi:hypothetical protein
MRGKMVMLTPDPIKFIKVPPEKRKSQIYFASTGQKLIAGID